MQPAEVVGVDPLPRPRKRRTGLLVAAVALVLAGAGTVGYVLLRTDQPSPQDKAVANCRAAVLEKLRAPGTAKFVGGEKVTDNGFRYFIEGEVDSQNGFGALLRTKYTCTSVKNGVAVEEVGLDTR